MESNSPLEDKIKRLQDSFNEFEENSSGFISVGNIGPALEACGEKIGCVQRVIIHDAMANKQGAVKFNDFIELYQKITLKSKQVGVREQKQRYLSGEKTTAEVKMSADGTKHSFVDDETGAFAEWINNELNDDPDLRGKYLPIDVTESGSLFKTLKDGVVLCKLVNWSIVGTIDERAINKVKLNVYTIHENQTLALNSASSIGCNIVNIGAEDIINGTPHLVLGLLWQLIRIGLFARISVKKVSGMSCLLETGEELEDLLRLPPEEILLRWVNYHLKQAGSKRRISNFSKDIKDSEVYAVLLKQIAPMEFQLNVSEVLDPDLTVRAEHVLSNAKVLDCRKFLRPRDIVKGNPRLNLAFVCNLFKHFPSLEKTDEEWVDVEETREEKAIRNWMNSLGVRPYVHDLKFDLKDGWILLQVLDAIKPGTVDFAKANKPPFKKLGTKMKKLENCNRVVDVADSLKFSVVGIGGQDILEGNLKFTLGISVQGLQAYTLSVLQKCKGSEKPVTEREIINWVNKKLTATNKESKLDSFKDPTISNSFVLLDLIDAIKPKSINYALVNRAGHDEGQLLNAKYAVSMARKIGAKVYALPEDIVEVKNKMVMTIFACLMALGVTQENRI